MALHAGLNSLHIQVVSGSLQLTSLTIAPARVGSPAGTVADPAALAKGAASSATRTTISGQFTMDSGAVVASPPNSNVALLSGFPQANLTVGPAAPCAAPVARYVAGPAPSMYWAQLISESDGVFVEIWKRVGGRTRLGRIRV
jgi:hypothetical protein